MIKYITLIWLFISLTHTTHEQVGIGTINLNTSSLPEAYYADKGILIPHAQKDTIIAHRLQVYNTSESCLQVNLSNSTIPNRECEGYSSPLLNIDCVPPKNDVLQQGENGTISDKGFHSEFQTTTVAGDNVKSMRFSRTLRIHRIEW